jgi:hypothetical protein
LNRHLRVRGECRVLKKPQEFGAFGSLEFRGVRDTKSVVAGFQFLLGALVAETGVLKLQMATSFSILVEIVLDEKCFPFPERERAIFKQNCNGKSCTAKGVANLLAAVSRTKSTIPDELLSMLCSSYLKNFDGTFVNVEELSSNPAYLCPVRIAFVRRV